MIKRFFKWLFKLELQELQIQINNSKEQHNRVASLEKSLKNVLGNIDISVDVHEFHRYSNSWAVISIQGKESDYIKFVDLGSSDIREIQQFLRGFERNQNVKIDAIPNTSKFLKISRL